MIFVIRLELAINLDRVLPNVFISFLNSNFPTQFLILQEIFPQSIPYLFSIQLSQFLVYNLQQTF